jgi:hypothetical protein
MKIAITAETLPKIPAQGGRRNLGEVQRLWWQQ